MTPDVVVDIGNTRMKWGRCVEGRVAEMVSLAGDIPEDWSLQYPKWNLTPALTWAVSSVQPKWQKQFTRWAESRSGRVISITREHIPIAVEVDEPNIVGIDRLLNALAGVRRAPVGTPVVTVSVGTAMTIDFVSEGGVFLGGQILPGPRTMARSLRDYTAALPLVETEPRLMSEYCGKNTVDAITTGINSAITGAVFNAVWAFCDAVKRPAWAFVTGGDSRYLTVDDFPDAVTELIVDPQLTLEGIRIAAEALP